MNRHQLEDLADRVYTDLCDADQLLLVSVDLSGEHLQQTLEDVDALLHAADSQLRRAFSSIEPTLSYDLPTGVTLERQIEWLFTVLERLDALVAEIED